MYSVLATHTQYDPSAQYAPGKRPGCAHQLKTALFFVFFLQEELSSESISKVSKVSLHPSGCRNMKLLSLEISLVQRKTLLFDIQAQNNKEEEGKATEIKLNVFTRSKPTIGRVTGYFFEVTFIDAFDGSMDAYTSVVTMDSQDPILEDLDKLWLYTWEEARAPTIKSYLVNKRALLWGKTMQLLLIKGREFKLVLCFPGSHTLPDIFHRPLTVLWTEHAEPIETFEDECHSPRWRYSLRKKFPPLYLN